jgi:acyl-CoA thioesterase FadM
MPAFYDDLLLIYVGVSELRRVQVTFECEVRRELYTLYTLARNDLATIELQPAASRHPRIFSV